MRISSNNSLTTQIVTSNASESFAMVLEKTSSPMNPTSTSKESVIKTTRGIPREQAHKYNTGLYFDRVHEMSDDEKFELINNVWKPLPNYEFPLTNKRKFSY